MKILWKSGLFLVAWGLLIAPFFVPFGDGLARWQQTAPLEARFYADSASAITILVATWLMTRFVDHRRLLTIGLRSGHILRDSVAGLLLGGLWLGVSVGAAWSLGWAKPLSPAGFSWALLAGAAAAMLLNVFTQQLLLCGFIFQTIRRHSNTWVAIILSSILFSLYHVSAFKGDWLPAINVGVVGFMFCFAYVTTSNLWFPMSIHFAWDVLLGPVLGLAESGKTDLGGGWRMFEVNGPPLFTGGSVGLEGGLIATLTAFAAISAMLFVRRLGRPARMIQES